MVNEEFKRQLTHKVADALVDRLEHSSNEALAADDQDRLRRLHTDGQILLRILLKGFQVVKDNEALPQKIRDEAEADITRFSEKFHVNLIEDVDDSNALKDDAAVASRSEDFQYCSTRVILPASTNIDALPQSGWTRVTGEKLIGFLGQIGPVDGIIRIVPKTTTCHWHPLPWYENVALVRLTDPTWKNKKLVLYYLASNETIFRLNGTSPPIHEVNAKAPIKLSQENAADYLRFFCFFVRGDEGPFYVVENIEDPFIPNLESPEFKKILLNNAVPITYEGQNEQGHFSFHATIFYSNALFKAKFVAHPTGTVEMLEDELIAGDLPGKVDAPLKLL